MPGWRRFPFFALLCLIALSSCGRPSAQRPNLVVIVIDTVRADRLSCYGYRRPTTPRIDELCARGLRFQNASSTSSWTLPAHASLFTGLFPISHGATQEHVRLDAGTPTLAEILGAHGYATFAVSDNPLVGANTGLDRGFDAFAETWRLREGVRQAEPERHPNLLATTRLLDGLEGDRPFFLFVNYVEAHGPYAPPEPHRSSFLKRGTSASLVRSALRRSAAGHYLDPSSISAAEFAVLNDLYDGEIARVDALVGALIDSLERAGRLDDTVVFITSDHGENIGDHGHFRHVFSLYDSTVRIPLIALLPGGRRAGEVRSEPVTLVDLFATVLSQGGIALPARGIPGRDILGDLEGAAEAPVFAEYYYPLQALGMFPPGTSALRPTPLDPYLRRLRSVQLGGLRLIASSDGRDELFDLSSDPAERRNLAGDARLAEQERRLHGLLDGFVERAGGEPPLPEEALAPAESGGVFGDFDPEAVERLRELGYLRE
jgi:arylsulfatase A-like enzyme